MNCRPVIVDKRFEFSAAHSHGAGQSARLHGHNWALWVGVVGPVAAETGMVINVTDLKVRAGLVLDRYDHRNLNTTFGRPVDTPEVALGVWHDLESGLPASVSLAQIELFEEGGDGARVTAGGVERLFLGGFASAHRTHAPRLSADENRALYGICNNPSGHGHNYRAEVRLAPSSAGVNGLWARYDHRNLSLDLPEFAGQNVVTELIAADIVRQAAARSARVWETPEFFADYLASGDRYRLGRRYRLCAAHRLYSTALSLAENEALYGKCSRLDPHGHTYWVEVTVAADGLEARTGTAYDLSRLDDAAQQVLAPLDYAVLETDVAFFQAHPSTGENIALHLWGEFERVLGPALDEVRVWETPNNRFTVRR